MKGVEPEHNVLRILRNRAASEASASVKSALLVAIEDAILFSKSTAIRTLARTVEACDAIQNGDATRLAEKLEIFEGKFRVGIRTVNAAKVEAYIKLRAENDRRNGQLNSQWTGPRAETLRRPGPASKYLRAVQEDQKARKSTHKRPSAQRAEEIIGQIPKIEDRQELRLILEAGVIADHRLRILKAGIEENFSSIRIISDAEGTLKLQPLGPPPLASSDRKALLNLKLKLADNDQLRHFGLFNESGRIKSSLGGGHFLSRVEYSALMHLLDSI